MADLYHGYLQSSSQEEIFRDPSHEGTVSAGLAFALLRKTPEKELSLDRGSERVLPLLWPMAITIAYLGSHEPDLSRSRSGAISCQVSDGAGFQSIMAADLPEVTAALDAMMRHRRL